jgi:serine/threonine-protein kinase HipA
MEEVMDDHRISIEIEISVNGEWHLLGRLDRGLTRVELNYDINYACDHMGQAVFGVSLAHPPDFSGASFSGLPPFAYDYMGGGFAKDLRQAGRTNTLTEWDHLKISYNPQGNLRFLTFGTNRYEMDAIRSMNAATWELESLKTLTYEANGQQQALFQGNSDTQGNCPKLWIVIKGDEAHADFGLDQPGEFCLMKFPRGKRSKMQEILRLEAPYLEVARALGLHVGAPLRVHGKVLLIPRFDRFWRDGKVIRLGQESLFSAAQVPGQQAGIDHWRYCDVITKFSCQPAKDLLEYVRRDILNLCMRNPDNHGRNNAFLKDPVNGVTLSPLYDFAPMYLDDNVIPRCTRWGGYERYESEVDWQGVLAQLHQRYGFEKPTLQPFVAALAELPKTCEQQGLPPQRMADCRDAWQRQLGPLQQAVVAG